MLELAVLGLLKEQAMHGYELRKQLSQRLGYFWTVSFGSLYPTLRRLERRGLVAKVPPGVQSSRRKYIYRITEAGEHEFLELLSEGATAVDEEKFPLRLAFFSYLRPETRLRLLERRKAYLESKREEGLQSLRRANRSRSDNYMLSLMRHGVSITEADIAWLEELIRAERAGLADAEPSDVPAAGDDEGHDEPDTEPSDDSPLQLPSN